MSMSTHVIGFAPPDEKWQQMKAIRDACKAAKVAVPKDVEDFFDWQEPDPAGVEVELTMVEWSDDGREGLEIEVEKIPAHVKRIRFYNSW
jgi:hypothetical protein